MVLEILQETKATLEARGWTRRTYVDSLGQVCLSEAFRIATDYPLRGSRVNFDQANQAANLILDEIARELGGQYSMIGYNDMPGRTKEQVINLLNRAIANASS